MKILSFSTSLLILIIPSLTFASVALQLSNKEMAEKADEIVIGTVKSIDYILDEKQQTPYTITSVSVERWIKGNSKEKDIRIRQIGGKFGDQQLFITGDARMKKGEKVLLFLKKGEEFRFVLALSQAKFSIIRDEKTGEEKAIRDISQLGLGKFDSAGKMIVEKQLKEKPVLLKDFLKEIESYIKK